MRESHDYAHDQKLKANTKTINILLMTCNDKKHHTGIALLFFAAVAGKATVP